MIYLRHIYDICASSHHMRMYLNCRLETSRKLQGLLSKLLPAMARWTTDGSNETIPSDATANAICNSSNASWHGWYTSPYVQTSSWSSPCVYAASSVLTPSTNALTYASSGARSRTRSGPRTSSKCNFCCRIFNISISIFRTTILILSLYLFYYCRIVYIGTNNYINIVMLTQLWGATFLTILNFYVRKRMDQSNDHSLPIPIVKDKLPIREFSM